MALMASDTLSVNLNFRVRQSIAAQIKAIAEREDRRVADVVRRIFLRGLAVTELAAPTKARKG